MAASDFLCQQARTPLQERLKAAGVLVQFSTNSESILKIARESLSAPTCNGEEPSAELVFWVDPDSRAVPPWPKPYFRGLGHLVFAGLGRENSLVIDLRGRRVISRLSPAMAADAGWWNMVIYPMLATVLGPQMGVTPLHCACVVRNGMGIILAGPSGSGKSTLSFALCRNGFDFLSEDWAYFSSVASRLTGWGFHTPFKLLPDAARFFPEVGTSKPVPSLNGEIAYTLGPHDVPGLHYAGHCEPRCILFLDRQPQQAFRLKSISRAKVLLRLRHDMQAETAEVRNLQEEVVQRLSEVESWQLEYGGHPDHTARSVREFSERLAPQENPVAGGK